MADKTAADELTKILMKVASSGHLKEAANALEKATTFQHAQRDCHEGQNTHCKM